jgi:hypothetical protein
MFHSKIIALQPIFINQAGNEWLFLHHQCPFLGDANFRNGTGIKMQKLFIKVIFNL